MTRPPFPHDPPRTEGPSEERPRPGGARVWIAGLAASAVLHLAFLFVYPILMARITPEPGAVAVPGPVAEPRGMEVVRLSELPEPTTEPLDRPEKPAEEAEEEPERPAPTTEPTPTERAPEAAPDPLSAAERLRVPEEGDGRIWRRVDPDLTALTEEQRARLRLLTRLEAMNDSALAEADRIQSAREWTYTDDEGKTWGVSPGQIHLGDVTIPMPFSFSAPPSARDAQAQWRWDDVERGAAASVVRDIWQERIEAIRERRDAERADTSGVRL